jgi:hypothetical protein
MLSRDELMEKMGDVRDALFDALGRHEAETHGGLACWPARASAVAFVAHCLGVMNNTLLWDEVGKMLDTYDAGCNDRCHPQVGGGPERG